MGELSIENFDDPSDVCSITIKNEYLVATAKGKPLAMVPDLIVIVDAETSTPINAERLHYGQRVAVLAIGAPSSIKRRRHSLLPSLDALALIWITSPWLLWFHS